MNFQTALERALRRLDISEDGSENSHGMPAQLGATNSTDQIENDPILKKQLQDAQQKGQNKARIDNTGDNKQLQKGQAAEQQKQQAEQQKQQQQGQQLGDQIAKINKDTRQLQAKIQGGAAKPSEINNLSQLLTAKDAVEKRFMRNFGVNSQ